MKYKYFVFSDVHGEYSALIHSLEKAGYKSEDESHKLICLGDAFDRGTDSYKIYRFLRKENAYYAMGNHDEFLLNYLTGLDGGLWNCIHNGLWETIVDFSNIDYEYTFSMDYVQKLSTLRYLIQDRNPDLVAWLRKRPAGYKLNKIIMTHAGFQNSLRLDNELDIRWRPHNHTDTVKFIDAYEPYAGDYTFMFGHWHAFRLSWDFLQERNKLSETFKWRNFIGLDGATNVTGRVNIEVIESDRQPIPFSETMTLEEIKKMK